MHFCKLKTLLCSANWNVWTCCKRGEPFNGFKAEINYCYYYDRERERQRQVPLKIQRYLCTWVMAADRAVQHLPLQPLLSCQSKGVCGYWKKEKQFMRYTEICCRTESHQCMTHTYEKSPGTGFSHSWQTHGHIQRDIHDHNQNRYFIEVRK